jgi:hypothetical protein
LVLYWNIRRNLTRMPRADRATAMQTRGVEMVCADHVIDLERITWHNFSRNGKINATVRKASLWNFATDEFLSGEALLACQGLDTDRLHVPPSSYAEASRLAGNGMSVPVLAACMLAATACVLAGHGASSVERPLWEARVFDEDARVKY